MKNCKEMKLRLWNLRGYDYPYLNKLTEKKLRGLFEYEFGAKYISMHKIIY